MDQTPVSAVDSSELRLSAVLGALVQLGEEMEADLDSQRARAAAAEERLAGVEDRLAEAERNLDDARDKADARIRRMHRAFADYVKETGLAQQALIALIRGALEAEPTTSSEDCDSASTPGTDDGPETSSDDTDHAPGSRLDEIESELSKVPAEKEVDLRDSEVESFRWPDHLMPVPDEDDEPTDEHRIIDYRNQLDMDRLDAPSYVRALRARG